MVKASERTEKLAVVIESADAVIIEQGAGLSTLGGFYAANDLSIFFLDFAEEYGITDIYSGGFFSPNDETRWAWWARAL